MDLPRFTSGAVGKLTFAHLNDAFETLDDLARDNGVGGTTSDQRGRLILGKLISESALTPGDWSWTEVAYDDGNYDAKPGGRSSSTDQSGFAFPARSATGDVLGANDVVVLAPMRDANGALYYVAAQPFARGTVTEPVQIQSSQVVVSGQQWLYTVRRATNSAYAFSSAAPDFEALNSVETRVDSGGIYGVGFGGGAASSLTRRPIENGITVIATRISPTRYVFSIPNGYAVNC